ncbi:site-specific integrase [Desulfosporosinus sp. PR]|uniref:tyrosine-type recombinase/integrase n=1 Tax=Candidatus Desulfosporosinus nitrosoreducens TaxID=3401928 RepID=UPI0027F4E15D|nr:site-specific integrase [Desulfosporosinus sp. PR]MDQ7095010.1 site-specific integrase [Desulfosporosinus sp. PR]
MAHAEYKGIGAKGQAKFRLYYDGPKNPDNSRNQKKESYAIDPIPEKAGAIAKAAKNRKKDIATKTEKILLERFEKKAAELADTEAKKREDKINEPNYVEPIEVNKEPFTNHSARWLKYKAGTARKGKRQPKTLWRYKQILERIDEFFKNDWVENIDIDRVEEFYTWLSVQKKKKGNKQKTESKETLSNQTQWHYHRCLYYILEYGVARGKLTSNPCQHVRPLEAPNDLDEKKPDSYTAEDAARIRELMEQEPLKRRVFTQIALEVGARPEEVHGLKWPDIDFKKRLIDFNKVWQYVPGEGSFEKQHLKNKHSRRKVRVSASTIFLLHQLKREQESDKDKAGDKWIDSKALFTDWKGKQLAATWAGDWWSKWIKTTDLPIKTLYCLRHTCISLLIAAGANPLEIARMVGHVNAEMIWRRYGHAIEKEHFAGAEIIESLIKKKEKRSEAIPG